jgi:hypothetical protein
LLCRRFLISCGPICQSFLTVAEPFEFNWWSACLCLLPPVSALSCLGFKISGLILRSLIHFELILIQGDRHWSSFSFLEANI